MVNLHMTFISWALEFLAGIVAIAGILFKLRGDGNTWKYVILPLDLFLNSIIIPGSYLVNNEVNRSLIATRGWYEVIRNTLLPAWHNQIAPEQPEPPIELNVLPPPIPTISGNINALEQGTCRGKYANIMQNLSARIPNETNETTQNIDGADTDSIESISEGDDVNKEPMDLEHATRHTRRRHNLEVAVLQNNWI